MRTDIATYLDNRRATANALITAPAPTAAALRYSVIHGDSIQVLKQQEAASVDFELTDPPYLINYKSRDARLPMTTPPTGGIRYSHRFIGC